jgi:CheY-like chemotaxis protein
MANWQRSDPARKLILLVDDDLHIRHLLHTPLQDAGYEIHEVENGIRALQWCLDLTADLFILDVAMPEMDGTELARELKMRQPDTPILAISTGDSVMSKEFCLRFMKSLGADETLPKPFDLDQLLKCVQRLLPVK